MFLHGSVDSKVDGFSSSVMKGRELRFASYHHPRNLHAIFGV